MMIGVPDEVLAVMFIFCLTGCYVAWRVAKRKETKLSTVYAATAFVSQLIGAICIFFFFFGIIRKQYQPETTYSFAPLAPQSESEMVRQTKNPSPPTCPDYFRWIHEDLWPWKDIGITEEMIKKGEKNANFRLVVVNGKAYVETYKESVQTRDKFTLWGILQLLEKYSGRIPDLDLIFFCHDIPQVKIVDYVSLDLSHSNSTWPPPPIFGYCSDEASLDIVFPDWAFWGWPETRIKPWEMQLKDLLEENQKKNWVDREPYAFWKGNKDIAPLRGDLMKCNPAADGSADWNARLFHQDWFVEIQNGFSHSNLTDQCNYRYKIYVDGYTWSVSKRYILACDSPTLLIDSKYHDFFSRGLMPLQHYYPIHVDTMCYSIKSTVTFGKNHQHEAQEIGREGSAFVGKELNMDRVYDYMFHLLNEYSKLLRFKPEVPEKAVEISSDSMTTEEQGLIKDYMMNSRIMSDQYSSSYYPSECTLPAPFTSGELKSLLRRKNILAKQGLKI